MHQPAARKRKPQRKPILEEMWRIFLERTTAPGFTPDPQTVANGRKVFFAGAGAMLHAVTVPVTSSTLGYPPESFPPEYLVWIRVLREEIEDFKCELVALRENHG